MVTGIISATCIKLILDYNPVTASCPIASLTISSPYCKLQFILTWLGYVNEHIICQFDHTKSPQAFKSADTHEAKNFTASIYLILTQTRF